MLSIVIDNYNYGRFLTQAIDSALGQTYRPIEVIVVDDGSTDDSRSIIRAYGDRVVPLFKDNGGQASALNAGFALCHGEVVIFLDADDVLLPGTAQRVMETLRANPAIAEIQYRMEVIDADGRPTGKLKPAPHLPLRSGDIRRHHVTFPFDMARMATSGNAFSVRVLRQILPIPEHVYCRTGADWYMCYLAPLFGPVSFLEDVGAYYRIHGGNKYEPAAPVLDLAHIRQAILSASATRPYIEKLADQLRLPRRPGVILSVSDIANRVMSLKLDPSQHPLPDDRLGRLAWMGVRASVRRFDIAWLMKCLFVGWFVAMRLSPKPLARWLAEVFSFPERRELMNRLLGALHVHT